jgi:hypothetical protein
MANGLFGHFKMHLEKKDIDLLVDDLKAVFVDHTDHTPDLVNDEFLSDIDAAGRVGTSGTLQNPTVSDAGVFDCDNITVAGVAGHQFESIVIYHDTGNAATSELICYIDTAANLPYTPTGGDIDINWNASGIFAL